ncbi:unnamed protein product [Larinioides sclopetarius]|uniref:Cytochrome P450 n=1 Tax=Larinioides sclopetarius TaxID=280406 RepID=A0AAV2AP64_9ARAC
MECRKKILPAEWNEEIFIDEYLKEMQKVKEKGTKTWFNENNLIGSAESFMLGGSDTSRTFLCWIFLAMATHPEVQENVRKDIDAVLGKDGKLPWSERAKLPYTYATLLETNRWRTVTHLSIPHCASEDTRIGGYDVPKGTHVVSNIYSLHDDPKYWKDTDSFRPDRFLDRNGCIITTKLDSYSPFSLGRRMCPGETVAMMEIFHYFTTVMQRFDIRPLENYPPNVDDGIDGVTFQPVRQKLRYIPRG